MSGMDMGEKNDNVFATYLMKGCEVIEDKM